MCYEIGECKAHYPIVRRSIGSFSKPDGLLKVLIKMSLILRLGNDHGSIRIITLELMDIVKFDKMYSPM